MSVGFGGLGSQQHHNHHMLRHQVDGWEVFCTQLLHHGEHDIVLSTLRSSSAVDSRLLRYHAFSSFC